MGGVARGGEADGGRIDELGPELGELCPESAECFRAEGDLGAVKVGRGLGVHQLGHVGLAIGVVVEGRARVEEVGVLVGAVLGLAADDRHFVLLDVGVPGGVHVRVVDEGHYMVPRDEALDVGEGRGRVIAVVLHDEVDVMTLEAALGVDRLCPGLEHLGRLVDGGGLRTGQAGDVADVDR